MDAGRLTQLFRVSTQVTSVIICGLLIALWVRSYYYLDRVSWPLSSTRGIEFVSIQGKVRCSTLTLLPAYFQLSAWGWKSLDSGSWPAKDEIEDSELGSVFLSPVDFTVWMAYRSLVLVGIAVGAVPWIKCQRRFSLRTLLVAVTVVAILLGLAMAF